MQQIGKAHGVQFDVEIWDAVGADVDLTVAGLFLHEMPGVEMGGGLRHLDQALHGALMTLRSDGIFSGAEGSTLMLTRPPAPIKAGAVLLVGCGDPTIWTGAVARRVTATAMREALRLRSATVAFAPGLLDSGLEGDGPAHTAGPMLNGAIDALADASSDAIDPRTGTPWVTRWTFDVGETHFAQAADQFRAAFTARCGPD